MDTQTILELGRDTLLVAAMIAGPLLLVAVVVGLAITIFQTVTSLQEQTLTFAPKVVAVLIAVLVMMPWLMRTICEFAASLLGNLDRFAS